jgi:hypothetical protein
VVGDKPAVDGAMSTVPLTATFWRIPAVAMQAMLLAAVTRVALAFVAWMSLRTFPRRDLYPAQLPDFFLSSHPLLDGWARWDAAHYIAVAQLGYGNPASPSPHGGVGFFPLYPLLMRGLVWIAPGNASAGAYAIAGIVISNLCFLAAVAVMAVLGTRLVGERAAREAVLLLCVAPFSFFFGAVYTESLFLLLVMLSLWFGQRGQWWAAGASAGLASATRLVGLLVGPALLWLAYKRKARWRDLAVVAVLSPSGLVAFFLYLWVKFDDLFAYFAAQSEWGGWSEHVRFYAELFVKHPREALGGDPRHLVILINVGILAIFVALLPLCWKRLDPGTALLTTLLVVVQGVTTWVSLGRYLMPAIGIFFVGGCLLTQPRLAGWPRDAIVVSSAVLMSLLTVLFAHGFWVV